MSTAKCPHCRKPVAPKSASAPFCSERCKLADLDAWLKEDYRIPASPSPDDEDDPQPNMAGPREEV